MGGSGKRKPGGIQAIAEMLGNLLGGAEFDDDELDDDLDDEFLDILDLLEEGIDNNGLRGASERDLRDYSNQLRSDPQMRATLNRLRYQCPDYLLDSLSQEARIVLLPEWRSRKKKR
jgi:hypothetical protein